MRAEVPGTGVTPAPVALPALSHVWNGATEQARAVAVSASSGATTVLAGARNAAVTCVGAGRQAVSRLSARLSGWVGDTLGAVTDVHGRRSRRRLWSGDGRAHVEVRGLGGRGDQHREVAAAVLSALRGLEGIHWAEVNAVLGQVVIAFDEDQVGTDDLVAVVETVEEAHGTHTEPYSSAIPHPPFDPVPTNLAAMTLAADCVGMAVAAAWRVLPLPALPRALRVPVVLAQTQPRVHRMLRRRLGAPHADMLLAVTSAVVHAATAGTVAPGVDAVQRVLKLAEIRSRQQAWHDRERDLAGEAAHLRGEVHHRVTRPVPLPAGPVETTADRTGAATLLGAAGVLAWTRSPGRAGEALLATVPKAAVLGREGFAMVLARDLALDGAVPMDGEALRLLDRITAVVIDSRTLCTAQPRVLSALATGDLDDAAVWGVAHSLLAGRSSSDLAGEGPWAGDDGLRLEHAEDALPGGADSPVPLVLDLVGADGRPQGRIRVGCELDPLADALIAAARSGAERVLLTEHASTGALLPLADEVLPAAESLTDHVRRLQADGHGVLLITDCDGKALAAADLGLAVLPRETAGHHHWYADLVCGPGLSHPWRVLHALGHARQVSAQSARLSTGASVLGALLAATGNRHNVSGRATSPVNAAAAVALLSGAATARKVARAPLPPARVHGAWHALDAREVLAVLRSQPRQEPQRGGGRSAASHLAWTVAGSVMNLPLTGALLAPVFQTAALAQAVRQELRDPLTPVLALGAAASAVVGSSADSVLVGGVMLGNALISGVQRLGAERALSGLLLRERLSACRVDRVPATGDGFLTELESAPTGTVAAEELCLGDIIELRASDVVPADARLLTADDLEIDEASLTGESVPVTKDPRPTPGADLAGRTCMVYQGCTVLAGSGHAVVTAVGAQTEAGRAADVAGPARAPVGIEGHLARLTKVALPATGFGGAAVTLLALLRGQALRGALSSGVAIAVAAVPEGLPLVATVAQSAAARRLSGRGVLVRSPRVLEALGRVGTVCFDKTGTLTEGRLSVTRATTGDRDVPLDSPHGRRVLRVAARACPGVTDGGGITLVHATDRAVVEAAARHVGDDTDWQLAEELPFITSRGYSASLGTHADRPYLAVKGAPEIVLERCATVLDPREDAGPLPLDARRRQEAEALVRRLADDGLRVLAVAEARQPSGPRRPDTTPADLAEDLTLVGFAAIADTARPGAAEAVAGLASSGARTVMITGDHPVTAVAIARSLGIAGADKVVTGTELETLPERSRIAHVAETSVFARVSPEQKVRIVRDLQRTGRVVAMVGDGTNDAAAIRAADVGIGVSAHGSTSARSASDLVLTDPDPTHILHALREGVALWGSVRDAAAILVGGNAGEVAFTIIGTAMAGRAPLSTRQLLLVNMLTDMLPALAVALAPAGPVRSGQEQPTPGSASFLLGRDMARILAVRGASTAIGALAAWQLGRMTGRAARASTIGLAALVGTQLGQTLVARRHSLAVVGTSAVSAAALFALVQIPGVSHFFGCTPLGPVAWTIALTCAACATAAAVLAPRVLFPAPDAEDCADDGTEGGTDCGTDAGPHAPAGPDADEGTVPLDAEACAR